MNSALKEDLIDTRSDLRWQTGLLSLSIVVVIALGLFVSLFFKEKWLWMDEVLSYTLVSDPSLFHLNDAVVSGMDANPPVFANLYWLIGHVFSLNPQFLRAVSIVIFASTIALFYRYTTRLTGTHTSVTNFVLITGIISLTYLNLSLATQIRAYALFLLIGCGYFIILHQLISSPGRLSLLVMHTVVGLLLTLTHSFGLFYLAASGAFIVGLWWWSADRRYGLIIGSFVLILVAWLLIWYPSFVIQTEAGKPHSWIPVPTVHSFFSTVGEILPGFSSRLERSPSFWFLPVLRFIGIAGLFLYLAVPRLKDGFKAFRYDKAFSFYLLAGFIYLATLVIALVVSLVYTSVFISRYLWPSHLLVVFQLVYAYHVFLPRLRFDRFARLLPVYMLLLMAFLFYQNRKTSIFPSDVLAYLPQLDKRYPVFVETADYFLPIWFHKNIPSVRYLLNWQTASAEGNILSATVEHKILKSVREKYHVTDIVTTQEFNRTNFPRFYVIDEVSNYQFEHYFNNRQIRIIHEFPIDIEGHRLLECTF
ncbi:hypothetical protein [Spirosoma utsteinense]|uniref:Glycosyltransferase RgtA/B/C/D-like domain-containing protein n=1 Tax=Spirosoma utsteinense TaxID=2585773 RepID=A0ABR6W9S4_9BACT|nr:hypothetical protein [Spirosoma utsteinense]MBC3787724.1 hypothetical protein [Spirosoma utsteinense]MBC3792672.1 hypothetical protein [Spirosoma utsteinense]